MKCFGFTLSLALCVCAQLPHTAYAETVDHINRARFTIGGAMRNNKQSLCKGARLIPGELTPPFESVGQEAIAQGEWTSYARLINQASSSSRKEALARKASAAFTRCATEKARGVARPLKDFFWWYDSAGSNSLEQDDTLYIIDSLYTIDDGESSEPVIYTDSTTTNIHSHYVGAQYTVTRRKALVYSGQLRIDDESGGIGVTFLSDYPNSDSYYRLRRLAGESLHIAPHPDQSEFPELTGDIDSEVTPEADIWYNFEIRTFDTALGTRILGKVWAESEPKPSDWQIDATDTSEDRFRSGKIGVWSMASGRKSWKGLKAKYLNLRPVAQ